jgi:SAM-dependent methyltransferase
MVATQLGRVLPANPARGLDWYYANVVLGARAREALRALRDCGPPRPGTVIDIGCGLGSFVLLARRLGIEAVGFEPGEEEVTLARQRAEEMGLDGDELFRTGRGERAPFPDNSATAIVLHDVLEHIQDWAAVLTEAERMLAPGGLLYVKSPNYAGLRVREAHYMLPWVPLMPRPLARAYLRAARRDVGYFDEHIYYLRRGAVLRRLRELGFELRFPRVEKLARPNEINRDWLRRLAVLALGKRGRSVRVLKVLAENPLQGAVDVVAAKPVAAD